MLSEQEQLELVADPSSKDLPSFTSHPKTVRSHVGGQYFLALSYIAEVVSHLYLRFHY